MIKEFDEHDFQLFNGAERFDDGKLPLIDASDENFLFVACKGRVEAVTNDEEDDYATYTLLVNFPTQTSAKAFMTTLPGTKEELRAFGFVKT